MGHVLGQDWAVENRSYQEEGINRLRRRFKVGLDTSRGAKVEETVPKN